MMTKPPQPGWRDITTPLTDGMPVYPGDPAVRVARVLDIDAGAPFNLTWIEAGVHSGTHVDAPVHFIAGAGGVETLDLDAMNGPAVVVDVREVDGDIVPSDVADFVPAGARRVLLRTRGEAGTAGPALTVEGAEALVSRGIRLVGIDAQSVAPEGDPGPVHVALLEAGVVILEGLDLREIEPGGYELICLPLRIPGADGAPARAALRPIG